MVAIWVLLAVGAFGQEGLVDGEVRTEAIDAVEGGDVRFQYFVNETVQGRDLLLTLTPFSDWLPPDLYISANSPPNPDQHDFSSTPSDPNEVKISSQELHRDTTYHILAHCRSYCRFSLVLSLEAEVRLGSGVPLRWSLGKDKEQVFTYEVGERVEEVTFVVNPMGIGRDVEMVVAEGGLHGELMSVEDGWLMGKSCSIIHPRHTTYWVSVIAHDSLTFLITAQTSATVTTLQAAQPTPGVVGLRQWQYFQVYVDSPEATLLILLTVYAGEPEVYVKAGEKPTQEVFDLKNSRFDNETISVDKHQREQFGAFTGLYFIGLFGLAPSAYLLTASLNAANLVPLYPSIPYSGFTDPSESFYFSLSIPVLASFQVDIKAQVQSGDLTLFAKFCSRPAASLDCRLTEEERKHPEHFLAVHKSKTHSNVREINFFHNETQCLEGPCNYVILAQGSGHTRSHFQLTASFGQSSIQTLRNEVPLSFYLPEGQSLTFKARVLDIRVLKVTFQLTLFTGHCFLCVSTDTDQPHNASCLKSSRNRADPQEQLVSFTKGVDFEGLNRSFYVAVEATSGCDFSILRTEILPNATSIVRLFSGGAQREVLYETDNNDQFRLYSFDLRYLQGSEKSFSLALTPFSGDFEVQVAHNASETGRTPLSFTGQWRLQGSKQHSNSLQVPPTDPMYLRSSTYLVLLRVVKWSIAHTASYSLLFTSGDGSVAVQAGVPLSDVVTMGNYRDYVMVLSREAQSVTVTVSAETGDPDLYISLKGRATKANFDYKGEEFGSEVLTLVHPAASESDQIYLSVYGAVDSIYSLTAVIDEDLPAYILADTPQVGRSSQSKYTFYYSFVGGKDWFMVSLQSYVGEASLYLNLLLVSLDGYQTWTRPNSASAQYKSGLLPHYSSIALQKEEIEQVCKHSRCRADISVQCKSADCRYSLLISQTQELRLVEGNLQYASCLRDKPVFFRFYNDKDTTNIVVRVTAVSSGDVDLYISKGTLPEAETAMWQAEGWGNEFLEIPFTDPIVGPALMRGEYYMAVVCDRNMTFSISLRTSAKTVVRLVAGQQQEGYIRGQSIDYYYFPSVLPEDVVISFVLGSGKATLYAISQGNSDEDIELPSAEMHYWSANSTSNLVISAKDPHFCMGCNVVIAVMGHEHACLYTILARNHGHITTLLNGQPSPGRLAEGQLRKYAFQHYESAGLDLSLSVFSGRPSFTAATTATLTSTDYNWTSSPSSHIQHIHISPADPAFRKGSYYVAVQAGGMDCSYSLTAHTEGSVVHLVAGWPQTYACAEREGAKLVFDYKTEREGGWCKVVPLTKDFYPIVYGKMTTHNAELKVPTLIDSEYASSTYDIYGQLRIPLWAKGPSTYLFAISGNRTHGEDLGEFQFYCLAANTAKVIRLNEVEHGLLDSENQAQEYQLHLPRAGSLTILVTPCLGKLELRVTAGNTTFTAKRVEDGRLIATFPCQADLYYLRVLGLDPQELERAVAFQLTASLEGSVPDSAKLYFAGNSGQLQWKVEEAAMGRIKLVWAAPETAAGEAAPSPQLIRYRVYATSEDISLASSCGMEMYETTKQAWLVLPETELFGQLSTDISLPIDTPVWVNILAILASETTNDLFYVPYVPIEVYLKGDHETIRLLHILEGLAALVVVLGGVLAVVCWKYAQAKKLQMKLVEMMDVATIAKDFNKSLKSERNRPSIEFTPLAQDLSIKE